MEPNDQKLKFGDWELEINIVRYAFMYSLPMLAGISVYLIFIFPLWVIFFLIMAYRILKKPQYNRFGGRFFATAWFFSSVFTLIGNSLVSGVFGFYWVIQLVGGLMGIGLPIFTLLGSFVSKISYVYNGQSNDQEKSLFDSYKQRPTHLLNYLVGMIIFLIFFISVFHYPPFHATGDLWFRSYWIPW